jgi:hypothetical protein
MKAGRFIMGAVMTVAGAAGFTACLLATFNGMRDVMRTDGGFCANGGPYVIAHQCSAADSHLLMVGILGGLLGAAVYAIGTGLLGRPAASGALLTWAALFGVLGWNFIDLGRHPGAQQGASSGWMIAGVVFWVMALGGLAGFLAVGFSGLRNPGRRSPALVGMQPLVRAAVAPGYPGTQPGGTGEWMAGPAPVTSAAASQPTRGGALLRAGAWLVASVAGAGLGIALSASLIATLR